MGRVHGHLVFLDVSALRSKYLKKRSVEKVLA